MQTNREHFEYEEYLEKFELELPAPLRVPTCNTAAVVTMPPRHALPGPARAVRPGPKAPYNPSASPCVPASASCRAAPAMAVRGRVGERASRDTAAPQAHFGPRAARTGARRAAHPTRDPKVDPGMCEKPCLLSAACAAGTTEREKPHCQNYLFTAAAGTTDALPGLGRRLGRRRSRLRSHRRRNRSRHSRRPGRATTDAGGTTSNKNLLEYKNPETTTEGRAARGANDARVVRPRACSRLRSHRRRSRRPGRAATGDGALDGGPGVIELDKHNKDAALPLIAGLQLLDVGDAIETVQTWVGDHLDPTSALRVQHTAESLHLGVLKARADEYIDQNFEPGCKEIEIGLFGPPRRPPRQPRPPPAPRRAPPRAAGTALPGQQRREDERR